jgi:hypothetical protein
MAPQDLFEPLTVALSALPGCGGSGRNRAADTSPTATEAARTAATTDEETTTAPPAPSPEVVAWADAWRRMFDSPLRKASRTFLANAAAAVAGNGGAAFLVQAQLDKLSNCRLPLETELQETPSELSSARILSRHACRSAFVGVEKFIRGWNKTNLEGSSEESRALVRQGIELVKKAQKLLAKATNEIAHETR